MPSTMPHPAVFPAPAAPAPQPRWVEVVSHLDPRYGGLSAAVPALGWSLAQGLGAAPVDISLAAFCAPGEHFLPAGFDPAQMRFFPASHGAWLRDRLRGGGALRRDLATKLRAADGIHIHGLWDPSTAVAAETARSLGKPYVLSAHGMLEPWALRNRRLKKLLYSLLVERQNVARATCLHALTHAEALQFLGFGARSAIAIVPNAVECPASSSPAPFFARFPALRGKRLILFMARLHPKKGLDLLVRAWPAVAARFPDAHLVLAGPDSEGTEARLRKMVASSGLQASVLIPGMLQSEMKWSALAASEAFVLPSFSEGLSVAVLEAMGMGLPVVITPACNLPEVGRHDAGWIVEPRPRPLGDALLEVLENSPAGNAAIGEAGAALVRRRFSWPVVAGQMAAVYNWTLGGSVPDVDLVFPA